MPVETVRAAQITQFALGTMRKRGTNVLCIHVRFTHMDDGSHAVFDYPVDDPNLSFIYPVAKGLRDLFKTKVSLTYLGNNLLRVVRINEGNLNHA